MTVTLTVRARPNESRTLELQTERYCLELSKYKFGVIKYKVDMSLKFLIETITLRTLHILFVIPRS